MQTALLTLCITAFSFVVVLIVYRLLNNKQEKMRRRLEDISSKKSDINPAIKKDRNKASVLAKFKTANGGKWYSTLSSELIIAGIALRPEEYILIWMLTSVGSAGIAYACGAQIIVIIGIFIIGAAIPPFMVKRMKAKTMANFDKQLIDAMAILGNCVRAGFTFQQGLESIAKEMPDPIAREFGRTLRELNLGMPMEESLNRLVKRTGNEDLDLLVSAIIIQRQVGGNLSEILDNICITIKERLKIKNEIKVLTATGRVSGYVVGLLPIFLMVILMVINPGYMKMFFTTPIGRLMLVVAFILEGIGFLLVKKVVDIKF